MCERLYGYGLRLPSWRFLDSFCKSLVKGPFRLKKSTYTLGKAPCHLEKASRTVEERFCALDKAIYEIGKSSRTVWKGCDVPGKAAGWVGKRSFGRGESAGGHGSHISTLTNAPASLTSLLLPSWPSSIFANPRLLHLRRRVERYRCPPNRWRRGRRSRRWRICCGS